MSRARPQAPEDAAAAAMQEARQTLRELHEAVKDARAALRDLRRETASLDGAADAARADYTAQVREIQEHIDKEGAEVRAAVAAAGRAIAGEHARVLGMKTPEEVVELICAQLAGSLGTIAHEATETVVARDLPGIVVAEMNRMSRGNAKVHRQAATVARVIRDLEGTGGL